jgi:hypothetical protein
MRTTQDAEKQREVPRKGLILLTGREVDGQLCSIMQTVLFQVSICRNEAHTHQPSSHSPTASEELWAASQGAGGPPVSLHACSLEIISVPCCCISNLNK